MASRDAVAAFKGIIAQFEKVDFDKVVRTDLGVESLEVEITPILDELRNKIDFATSVADYVSDQVLNQFQSHVQTITDQCNAQSNHDNQQYIANKESFLAQIKKQLNAIHNTWPPFVTAAVEQMGLLTDEGVKAANQQAIEELNKQSSAIIENLKTQAQSIVSEAQEKASTIEKGARRTAAGVSLEEAQNQFKDAQKPLVIQLIIWSILSVLAIVAFGFLFWEFLKAQPSPEWEWRVIYYTAIRLAALGALGSLTAYFLKILKSQLHLFQKNLHRRRVANCMEALVESAWTEEHRDTIYAKLVEAITDFGDTGLIEN